MLYTACSQSEFDIQQCATNACYTNPVDVLSGFVSWIMINDKKNLSSAEITFIFLLFKREGALWSSPVNKQSCLHLEFPTKMHCVFPRGLTNVSDAFPSSWNICRADFQMIFKPVLFILNHGGIKWNGHIRWKTLQALLCFCMRAFWSRVISGCLSRLEICFSAFYSCSC